MRKRLHETTYFRLTEEHLKNPRKRGQGHRHYRIVWHGWQLPLGDEEKVRDIVDPKRNISGRNGCSWIFKDRTLAEQKYAMLLMKWGA